MDAVRSSKPNAVKGTFVKTVTFTSTMGPGIPVDPSAAQTMSQASSN
jgi:large subunit ribosomal protein L1